MGEEELGLSLYSRYAELSTSRMCRWHCMWCSYPVRKLRLGNDMVKKASIPLVYTTATYVLEYTAVNACFQNCLSAINNHARWKIVPSLVEGATLTSSNKAVGDRRMLRSNLIWKFGPAKRFQQTRSRSMSILMQPCVQSGASQRNSARGPVQGPFVVPFMKVSGINPG